MPKAIEMSRSNRFKNVFVLCTGRSGSTTLAAACKHITNYSSDHESKASEIGSARLDYDDWHIEADNRLSWMLGNLEERYGNDAFYVHLQRDKSATVKSFGSRWNYSSSIIKFLTQGVFSLVPELLGEKDKEQICEDYVDIITANIKLFLKDKSNQMDIHLETIGADFQKFWVEIGAEGDLDAAIKELNKPHNAKISAAKSGSLERKYELELELRILSKKLQEEPIRGNRLALKVRIWAAKLAKQFS